MSHGGRSSRAMSLIPYEPDSARQIILRHQSTVVVYDKLSKRITLRTEEPQLERCPTCHRSYDHIKPQEQHSTMSPGYWNLLQHSITGPENTSRPHSPVRRLVPTFSPEIDDGSEFANTPPGAEFIASEPQPSSSISSKSFSQGYFESFFRVEKELGKGGRGVVMLVSHYLDNCYLGQFACKRVPVGNNHAWLAKVLLEVQTLQQLSHLNLVQYKHVWLENMQLNPFTPEMPYAYILQQYCDSGDLHQYVLHNQNKSVDPIPFVERMRRKSRGQLGDSSSLPHHLAFDQIVSFFKDITSGLHHLHSHNFIHRDVKPSNCLLHHNGKRLQVLLSDFGEVQVSDSVRSGSGATGTVSYCAPEVLRMSGDEFGNFTVKSDIFSLGMVVYFMCFARLPYTSAEDINEDREDVDRVRAEILSWPGLRDIERRGRHDLPERLYTSLKRLLAINPDNRPSTDEILHEMRAAQDQDDSPEVAYSRDPRISKVDSPMPRTRRQSSSDSYHLSPRSPMRPGRQFSPAREDRDSLTMVRKRTNIRHDSRSTERSIAASPSPSPSPHRTNFEDNDRLHTHKNHTLSPSPSRTRFDRNRGVSPSLLALPPPPPRSLFSKTMLLVPLLLKIILFLFKCITLWTPCRPFSVQPLVAYPLLVLAALDLSQSITGFTSTLGLLGVHLGLVFWAGKWYMLCDEARLPWDG
jgi:serine/threonine protein kinase